jgi:dolichol-phosphate mannosyltransferase
MRERALVSVVVPLLDEAAVLRAFHERATKALEQVPGVAHELVYVDDGSRDGSFALLAGLATDDPRVRVVRLSRNFGQQIAITAGLDRARGDCAVVIDADLQDPPEVIADLVAAWRQGFDVVHAVRRVRRGESAWKRASAGAFYRLLSRIAGVAIPRDVGDFRLLGRRALDELAQLREKDRYVRGLVSWIGLRQTTLAYDRDERAAGATKYAPRRMARLAVDGVTSFSRVPLELATWLGLAATALGLALAAALGVGWLRGAALPSWAPVAATVLLVGGAQLVCLGILGAYVGRILSESKPRPLYVVEREIGPDPLRPY